MKYTPSSTSNGDVNRKKNTNEHIHGIFELTRAIQANTASVNDDAFVRTISVGGNELNDDFVTRDMSQVLLGAVSEADLDGFSIEVLKSQYSQVAGVVDGETLLRIFKNESNDICIANINGKFKLWEARLLEIMNDAMILRINDSLQNSFSLQEMTFNTNEEVLVWEKKSQENSDTCNEILLLFDKVYATKTKKEDITKEMFIVEQNMSIHLQSEQSTLLAQITNAQISSTDYHFLFENRHEKKIRDFKNLISKVNIMNKLTWCKVTEMTKNSFKVEIMLSDLRCLDVHLILSSNGDLNIQRNDMYGENVPRYEGESYLRYFDKVFCDHIFRRNVRSVSVSPKNRILTWQREICGCNFSCISRSKKLLL